MKCSKCNQDKYFTGWTETDKTPKVLDNSIEETEQVKKFPSWYLKPYNKAVFICKECKK